MKRNNFQGFSLAELIVSMSIIVIISTMGVLYFIEHSNNSRDVVRGIDIANLSKALVLNRSEGRSFPTPDNSVDITYSGGTVWVQGSIGEEVIRSLPMVSEVFTDPKYDTEYTYSVSHDNKYYQIGGILEGDTELMTQGFVNTVYAESDFTAYVQGNLGCGRITQIGDNNLILPSLISSSLEVTDYMELLDSNSIVTHGGSAIPSTYKKIKENNGKGFGKKDFNPLIFTGSKIKLKKGKKLDNFVTQLQESFSGTQLSEDSCYGDPSLILKENYGMSVIFADIPDPSVTSTPTSTEFDWVYSKPNGDLYCKSEKLTSFRCEFPSISLTEGLGWGTDNTFQYFVNGQECGPIRDALTYTGALSVEQCPWNFKAVGKKNTIQVKIPSGWWYELSPEKVKIPLPPFNTASLILNPNGRGFDFSVNSENLTTDFRFYVNGHWCDQVFAPGEIIEGRIDEQTNPACGHLLNTPGEKQVMIRYNADTGNFWSDEVTIEIK